MKKQIQKCRIGSPGLMPITPEQSKRFAEWLLKGVGKAGEAFNEVVASALSTPMGTATTAATTPVTNSGSNAKVAKEAKKQTKEFVEENGVVLSPSSWVVGKGNPWQGAQTIATWDPRWQLGAFAVDALTLAKGKPALKATGNAAVDVAARAGSKTSKAKAVSRRLGENVGKAKLEQNSNYTPEVRTKVGDIEINNPQLAYRQVGLDGLKDFQKSGVVRVPEGDYGSNVVTTKKGFTFDFGKSFNNPMFSQGRLWYGIPENQGGLLVTAEPLGIGTKRSNLMTSELNGTFDLRYPYEGMYGRRVPLSEKQLTPLNTTAYRYVPGYGYRLVTQEPSTSLKFFERPQSKLTLAERVGVPKGERAQWNPEVMQNAKQFAEKYGYEVPTTIEEAKNMYRQHNRFFRTVDYDSFSSWYDIDKGEFVEGLNTDWYPEFTGMNKEQTVKTLASKGYPVYYRSRYSDHIGSGFRDDFVFVSPSLMQNAHYQVDGLGNTVMLQRPFSFGHPSKWHINADWEPVGDIQGRLHTKGEVSKGNSSHKYESKVSTDHLIPVKIAEESDKGSLKGEYLENLRLKGSRIGDPLGFGQVQTPTIQNRPAPAASPLVTRLMRLQNKKDAGIIPKTDQALIIRDGQSDALIEDQIVKAYKRLGIEEDVARSAARTTVMNNGKGVHTPVIGDDGNLIGGISYIDRQQALKALRESGITNPTESDLQTIMGHEWGHQVEVPGMDKEVYTQLGQVLDNEGVIAANPNWTVWDWINKIEKYLSEGRLDNGISNILERLYNMDYKTAQKFVANANKFSAGTGAAYLLNNQVNKNE